MKMLMMPALILMACGRPPQAETPKRPLARSSLALASQQPPVGEVNEWPCQGVLSTPGERENPTRYICFYMRGDDLFMTDPDFAATEAECHALVAAQACQ